MLVFKQTIEQTILLQLMTSLRSICQTEFVGQDDNNKICFIYASHHIMKKRTISVAFYNLDLHMTLLT